MEHDVSKLQLTFMFLIGGVALLVEKAIIWYANLWLDLAEMVGVDLYALPGISHLTEYFARVL